MAKTTIVFFFKEVLKKISDREWNKYLIAGEGYKPVPEDIDMDDRPPPPPPPPDNTCGRRLSNCMGNAVARCLITRVSKLLTNAPRFGSGKNEVEVRRHIQISDTLAKELAKELADELNKILGGEYE